MKKENKIFLATLGGLGIIVALYLYYFFMHRMYSIGIFFYLVGAFLIWTTLLFKEMQKRRRMLNTLKRLDASMSSTLEFSEILEKIAESVANVLGFKVVLLSLVNESKDLLERKVSYGIPDEVFKKLQKKPVPMPKFEELLRDEYKISNSYFISHKHKEKIESHRALYTYTPPYEKEELKHNWHPEDIFFVPLLSKEGKILGIMSADKPADRKIPSMEKIELIESFAHSASRAIENAKAFEDATTNLESLTAIYQVTTAIGGVMKLDDLLRAVLSIVHNKFGYSHTAILLLDKRKQFLTVKESIGYPSFDVKSLHIRVGKEGVTGFAVKQQRPVLVPNVREEPMYIGDKSKPKSEIAIPLKTKYGLIGVLDVEAEGANSLTEGRDLRLLSSLATYIGIAIDNARLYGEVSELAVTDGLTGVHNYRYLKIKLSKLLERAKSNNLPLSLLMLDLDNFKNCNDSLGHLEGDKILRYIAHLLLKNVRKDDVFTRYGGDEFMVILPDTDKAHAFNFADRLKEVIKKTSYNLTASVGIATYPDDSEFLIDFVDKALYKAKEKGKDSVFGFKLESQP